eukprot:3855920-Amphidinium_carterae.2
MCTAEVSWPTEVLRSCWQCEHRPVLNISGFPQGGVHCLLPHHLHRSVATEGPKRVVLTRHFRSLDSGPR